MVSFYREIVTTHPDYRFEMIVVDDGSTDGTAEALIKLAGPGEPIRVVCLSRNFGSHPAVSAGLAFAEGDAAITLSADRQEPLEAIRLFLDQWRAGADLVWGLRELRVQQGFIGRRMSQVFSAAFGNASEVSEYPVEGPSQMLVDRAVIDALNALPEGNRNVLALAGWLGFEQRQISYPQSPRPHGQSKWTFSMKLKLVWDSFVAFSRAPLRWLTMVGLALMVIGLLGLVGAIILAVLGSGGSAAVAAVCGVVLLVGGINLFGVVVLGEYAWRAGADARRRPVYVVKRVLPSSPREV